MLAIQENFVRWEKNSRTPQASLVRKPCFLPHKIDKSVDLNGGGIFVCKNIYYQYDKVYTPEEIQQNYSKTGAKRFDSEDSYRIQRDRDFLRWQKNVCLPVNEKHEHNLLELDRMNAQRRGCFYVRAMDVNVPGVDIVEENGKCIVKWLSFDYSGYMPVRNGYNEDYKRKGAKARGKRIMCETAFILGKGESGKIDFNYRYTSYYGQHYEQYSIYFINTDRLYYNSFMKAEYGYRYSQMADLF